MRGSRAAGSRADFSIDAPSCLAALRIGGQWASTLVVLRSAPKTPLSRSNSSRRGGSPASSSISRTRGTGSGADGLADAAQMVLDVVDQDALDGLLGGHGRYAGEHGAALLQIRVGEPAHYRGGGLHALLVQGEGLGLGAAREVLGVLGVHLV